LRRNGFEIVGSVAHGDALCRKANFNNGEVFAECARPSLGPPDRPIVYQPPGSNHPMTTKLDPIPMSSLGLLYEANYIGHELYLSDTGGRWSSPLAETKQRFKEDGGLLQVLTHEVWWALSGERVTRREPRADPPASSAKPETSYDRLYRSTGFGYDTDRDKWADWVEKHYIEEFGLVPGQRLLDLGCGDGFWSGIFAEKGFEVVGVDLSEGGIEVARQRYTSIEFLVADAELQLPFPPGSFDIVFARGLSHFGQPHLTTSRGEALMENLMMNVREGGLALVSVYTTRDGKKTESWTHHTKEALLEFVNPFGRVRKTELVGNYVQIALERRNV
jgi:hypothetical protein